MGDDLADLDALIDDVDPCTGPDYTDFVNLVRIVKHMRRLIGDLTEREGGISDYDKTNRNRD